MKFRGLFLGLTTIDIQYFVSSHPLPNRKIKSSPPKILIGGPATNAAVAFAHLNNGAFLASATGNNSFNEYFKQDFLATKIRHFDLVETQNINPVIASVITNEQNGDRNIFTHIPDLIKPAITPEKLFELIKPEIVFTDGFYPEFNLDFVKLASSKKIPVVLDCGSWKSQYELLLNYSNYVICSEDFLPPDCLDSNEVFSFLKDKKIDKIAISRGEKNILYMEGQNKGDVKIQKTDVKDTLGAGDFLHGAFCFYLLNTNNFKKALKQAADLATFSCTFKGTREWLKSI